MQKGQPHPVIQPILSSSSSSSSSSYSSNPPNTFGSGPFAAFIPAPYHLNSSSSSNSYSSVLEIPDGTGNGEGEMEMRGGGNEEGEDGDNAVDAAVALTSSTGSAAEAVVPAPAVAVAAAVVGKKRKRGGTVPSNPSPEERWVANADKRVVGGPGPEFWMDTIVRNPKMIFSTLEAVMPPLPTPVLLETYSAPPDAKYELTRPAKHSIAISGKDTVGKKALKFDLFQILRLVYSRYLSHAMFLEGWAIVGTATKTIIAGDWNGTNLFIRLHRHFMNEANNYKVLRDNFSQDVMDRVNIHRQQNLGFLSLAAGIYRYDPKKDPANCFQAVLTE